MDGSTIHAWMGDVLHTITQGLLVPDILLLILFIGYALFCIGSILVEFFTERKHFKVTMPKFLAGLMAAEEEGVPAVIEESGLLKRQKIALLTVYDYRMLPGDALVALIRRLVAEEESRYDRISGRNNMAARVSPMLGLMGTLIPLGPGIQALGNADTATLSSSLLIAFDTTVAGLVVAAICMIIGKIRSIWYSNYMSALDTGMATILQKIEDMRAEGKIVTKEPSDYAFLFEQSHMGKGEGKPKDEGAAESNESARRRRDASFGRTSGEGDAARAAATASEVARGVGAASGSTSESSRSIRSSRVAGAAKTAGANAASGASAGAGDGLGSSATRSRQTEVTPARQTEATPARQAEAARSFQPEAAPSIGVSVAAGAPSGASAISNEASSPSISPSSTGAFTFDVNAPIVPGISKDAAFSTPVSYTAPVAGASSDDSGAAAMPPTFTYEPYNPGTADASFAPVPDPTFIADLTAAAEANPAPQETVAAPAVAPLSTGANVADIAYPTMTTGPLPEIGAPAGTGPLPEISMPEVTGSLPVIGVPEGAGAGVGTDPLPSVSNFAGTGPLPSVMPAADQQGVQPADQQSAQPADQTSAWSADRAQHRGGSGWYNPRRGAGDDAANDR